MQTQALKRTCRLSRNSAACLEATREVSQECRPSDGSNIATIAHRPTTDDRRPITDYRLPITDYRRRSPPRACHDRQPRARGDAVAREPVPALDLGDGGIEELRDAEKRVAALDLV